MSNIQQFWDNEYQQPKHLALSEEASEDLEKFLNWLARAWKKEPQAILGLDAHSCVLDLGCGNGRNLVYLAKIYGCRGLGYDISGEGVQQARNLAKSLGEGVSSRLTFETRTIAGKLSAEDESVDLVLDMMTSHFLDEKGRVELRDEIARVLKPGGWLYFKTFCADGDIHTKRLMRDVPSGEAGTYIHPKFGVAEHAWTEVEIEEFFKDQFEIKKIEKSHKHILHGKAFKRRTMSVYLEKKW